MTDPNDWTGLDPENWDELRALGHRVMDDMIDHLANLRTRPVWRPMPDAARRAFAAPMPRQPSSPAAAYDAFKSTILPYELGNTHPGFMGWVHGGGNPAGMLAELLAASLNNNCGGRDHVAIAVERQVIAWSASMLGLPPETSGLLVTGTSIANLIAVLTARTHYLGAQTRRTGIANAKLRAYASLGAHSCVPRALDMAGFGSDALRTIPTDADHRIDLPKLRAAIDADQADGATPFMVVATAGSVDTGAIDNLPAIADLCAERGLWFHIDAAFGAMLALSPSRRHLIAGIERADSIAFDFHKWAQVQYDAGCILIRDPARQSAAFAQSAPYLARDPRGLAAGTPWPCDLGPDLSRGFRALKVWMTLQTYGADAIGRVVDHGCDMAQRLAARIDAEPTLERLAPVALNIVCFRCIDAPGDLDDFNAALVANLQQTGLAVPSTTTINGKLAIRAALVNHRTRPSDTDRLIDTLLVAANLQAGRPRRI